MWAFSSCVTVYKTCDKEGLTRFEGIVYTQKVNIAIWERAFKMSTTSSFVIFVLICFVGLASCKEPKEPELNGTTIIWHDDFDTDSSEGSGLKTEYDAKGLQPWYDFVNSFIGTVLNKEPYGKYSYTVCKLTVKNLFCFHFLH